MHFNLQIDDAPGELGRRRPPCDHPACADQLDYFVRLELNGEGSKAQACAHHVFEVANQLLAQAKSSVRLQERPIASI